MAKGRSKHEEPVGAIEGLESWGERAGEWLETNARHVLVIALICLVLFGGYGAYDSWSTGQEEAASDALSRVRGAYLLAMGAGPESLEPPELANPAIAAQVRQEYAVRFREVAEEHRGTVAGALARLEEGELREAAGDTQTGLETLNLVLEDLSRGAPLRGLVQQRIARAHEDAERWPEAAAAHLAASELAAYPLRWQALADAARCYAAADDSETALALYGRIESEAPDFLLDPHLKNQFQELRAASAH